MYKSGSALLNCLCYRETFPLPITVEVFYFILGLLCKATKAGFQALLAQSNFKTAAMLKKGMTEHTELAGVGDVPGGKRMFLQACYLSATSSTK